jgi:hypothetical protein
MNDILQSVIFGNRPAVEFAGIKFNRMTYMVYRQEDADSVRIWTPADPYQYKVLNKASNTIENFAISN